MKRSLAVVLLLVAGCGGANTSHYTPPTISPDAIRKTCAMATSCLPMPQFSSGGQCVTQIETGLASGLGIIGASVSDLSRLIACTTSATECGAAIDCFTRKHGADYCAAHNEYSCDGDLLVTCVNSNGLGQLDCAAYGMHCVSANGAASCSDGKGCDPKAADRCSGDHFVSCDGTTSLESTIDCSIVIAGGTCVDGLGCTPPVKGTCSAASCDSTSSDALLCNGGRQLPVPCSLFASACGHDGDGAHCIPTATACSDGHDQCDPSGAGLQICVNGQWTTTACSSIGLTTCTAPAGGQPSCT
jgi:hypothetical protein